MFDHIVSQYEKKMKGISMELKEELATTLFLFFSPTIMEVENDNLGD